MTSTTRAIRALIEIMSDETASTRRRIEACDFLLAYEAPREVMDLAKEFLASIFEDQDQHVDDRLDALKLSRKVEAPRIRQRTAIPADEPADRELWRRREIAHRRVAMIDAGLWPPPKDWADDLLSDVPASGPPEVLEAARR
jgi:hypothetical protein